MAKLQTDDRTTRAPLTAQTAMAKDSKLFAVALLFMAALLAAALLYSAGPSIGDGDGNGLGGRMPGTTLPFSPMDVLPLLPRSVAMAVLRKLRGVADIFPVFVGAASAKSGAVSKRLEWKGACFYQNEAWLEFHNDSGSKYGGGTLHLEVWSVPA